MIRDVTDIHQRRSAGVALLNEPAAVFGAMLEGFAKQQASRGLATQTILTRRWQLERLQRFTQSYPWQWVPGDVEDYSTNLLSAPRPLARSTVRIYHLTIRMFCEYLIDQRYGWVAECRSRFGLAPSQVCFEWNTIAHVGDFEALPGRRPLDYAELESLFAAADSRVDELV